MSDTPITIFISYARTDMQFVDQLDMDLQMRGFVTWVDRSRLEGGQNWLDDIEQAIKRCDVLLVALSPEAVESKYVRMEYRYANSMHKLVIPIQYRLCTEVPIDLNGIHWIDFIQPYNTGLDALLASLAHVKKISFETQVVSPISAQKLLDFEEDRSDFVAAQPAPSPPESSSDELYLEGLKARSDGDLERAVALWQRIFDRDPNYKDGTFASQRENLLKNLRSQRINRLRRIAEEASRAGDWDRELSSWEVLLRLAANDKQAQRRLNLARKHQQHAWHYENALQFMRQRQLALAQTELQMLWDEVPYYGDPAYLARELGLPERDIKPKDYNEEAERRDSKKTQLKRQLKPQEAGITTIIAENFVKFILGTTFFRVQVALFCLLSGTGSAAGMLTHSPIWSVGIVIGIMIFAYVLGYRKAIHVLIMLGIVFISAIIAFGTAEYGSTLATTQQSANFWFIESEQFWDERQLDCGLFTGVLITVALFVILKANNNRRILNAFFTMSVLAITIIAALIVWAIILFASTLAGWGFGFGPGWHINLIGLIIGIASGLGLVSLGIVFSKSLKN